jgi:hypothetical protein
VNFHKEWYKQPTHRENLDAGYVLMAGFIVVIALALIMGIALLLTHTARVSLDAMEYQPKVYTRVAILGDMEILESEGELYRRVVE